MSRSPDAQSDSPNASSTSSSSSSPHSRGKGPDTPDTTISPGFTAVNTRSPPQAPPKLRRSVNGVDAGAHSPPPVMSNSEVATTTTTTTTSAHSYEPHDSIRVSPVASRGSPGDEPNAASPGRRRTSTSDGGREREQPSEQGDIAPQDKRPSPPAPPPPPPPHPHAGNWSHHAASAQGKSQMLSYPPPDLETRETPAWYGTARPQPHPHSPDSDTRLVDLLQRESQNMDARPMRVGDAPQADHIGGTPQHQITSTTETTAAGVQVDPKKRKRVFSNRTKTGCQTCRKRKKKCDEDKPECQNCKRGGFVCEGYSTNKTWGKPTLTGKVAPIAIQSRTDGYGDTGGLMPRPRSDYHDGSPTQTANSQGEGTRSRPFSIDDDRSRSTWGTSTWSDSPSRPNYPPAERGNSNTDFPHGMPYPDPMRPQQSYEERSAHHPPVTSQGQSISQSAHGTQAAMAAAAQLALQHTQSSSAPTLNHHLSSPPSGKQKTEKDKMLAGEPYYPYTTQLMDEREACVAALWRFNNSQNPATGVSREERNRLFRSVLVPVANDVRRSTNPTYSVGQIGKDVQVEAPFHCSYGYNISIGENVIIEANCTIMDPCRVTIGDNTVIGPNVSIYAATLSVNPDGRSGGRNGARGPQLGKMVHIGDNVFIGGNVVIKPGVSIGNGATVAAGTVVDKSVPGHVIFSGPRSDVRHGIFMNRSH